MDVCGSTSVGQTSTEKAIVMIHFSCDRCQRRIETDDEVRYVVRLEVQATLGEHALDGNEDDDRDHLLEVHEILERHDDKNDPLISDEIYNRRRFDLCSNCHRAFLRNPLGREVAKTIDFSQN